MASIKTIKNIIQNWLHLKCKLFNTHKYVLENKYSNDILKLNCKKCNKKFGVNLKSYMIFAWDEDMTYWLSLYQKDFRKKAKLPQTSNCIAPMKIVV